MPTWLHSSVKRLDYSVYSFMQKVIIMQKTNVFGNYVVKNKYRPDFSAEMTAFTMITSGVVVAVGVIAMV